MRLVGLTAALAIAAAAPAAAQVDPAAQAKVMDFVGDFGSGLGVAGAEVTITFVDLNRDGTEEALVRIVGASYCGTRGCSAFALDLSGAEARSIGDFTAHELAPLASMTNGWHDVTLGSGSRFTFDGSAYRFDGR